MSIPCTQPFLKPVCKVNHTLFQPLYNCFLFICLCRFDQNHWILKQISREWTHVALGNVRWKVWAMIVRVCHWILSVVQVWQICSHLRRTGLNRADIRRRGRHCIIQECRSLGRRSIQCCDVEGRIQHLSPSHAFPFTASGLTQTAQTNKSLSASSGLVTIVGGLKWSFIVLCSAEVAERVSVATENDNSCNWRRSTANGGQSKLIEVTDQERELTQRSVKQPHLWAGWKEQSLMIQAAHMKDRESLCICQG